MIDGQESVRFATAEGGLQLYDWLASFAAETLGHLRQEEAHALGNESSLKEGYRITVLRARLTCANGGDVRGELGLLKRTF
jgi:hypothetical protein